jgi:hypothetical protein
MTTLTEFKNLSYAIDDTEIYNDLRVQVPNYSYVITWVGLEATVTYSHLVITSLSGSSINKYGRRSKVNKFQVINDAFKETWVENTKQEKAEPYADVEIVLSGTDDNIVYCLSINISDVLTLVNATTGINADYIVCGKELEMRLGFLEAILKLKAMTALQQTALFIIDTDLIDGDHVIG